MEFKNSKTANRRRYKSRYHSPHNYKTQRSKSENRAAILVAVATFLVIASLVLIFTFGDSIYTFFDGMLHPPLAPTAAATEAPAADPSSVTEPPTMAPTAAPTEPPTEAPTKPPVQQDAAFTALLAKAGLDADSIIGSQIILVETSDTNAAVYTYEKDDQGVWNQKFAPVSGYIGEDGASASCVPGDRATPLGTYAVEYAMGVNDDPGTPLKYYPIVYGMRWVTDPASINYNRMVDEDATYIDFETCQWLHEYTVSYPYAVVFDYNRDPVDSSQGCAKFLHVASGPTRGGVGIDEDTLREILLWLDPGYAPTISIF